MGSNNAPMFDKDTEALDVAAAFPGAIKGRTILITGVNKAGIGYTTAEAFASQSPRCLILAGRSPTRVSPCLESLQSKYPDIDIRMLMADLSSQKSIRSAADEVNSWTEVPAIHLVINNAGVMRHGETFDGPIPKSEDGIEQMFATNHLGHFLLTNLIMPKIIAATKTIHPGSVRIINLTSTATWISPLRPSDLGWQKPGSELPEEERPRYAMMKQVGMNVSDETSYIPTAAYGHSKTCNILFSAGLNERLYSKHSILSLALNPGEIKTDLSRNTDSEWLNNAIRKREEMGLMHWKTQGGGASTTLVAACDPSLSLPGPDGKGLYLSDCQVGMAPPYASDKEAADKLWQISERLTGQEFVL